MPHRARRSPRARTLYYYSLRADGRHRTALLADARRILRLLLLFHRHALHAAVRRSGLYPQGNDGRDCHKHQRDAPSHVHLRRSAQFLLRGCRHRLATGLSAKVAEGEAPRSRPHAALSGGYVGSEQALPERRNVLPSAHQRADLPQIASRRTHPAGYRQVLSRTGPQREYFQRQHHILLP